MAKAFFRMIVLALAIGIGTAAPAQETKRAITKVAGDVYRFQNNNHFALVTVTGAGVVLVDTIYADAMKWLKANLGSISDKPITHLIYSHSHGDHASGGGEVAGGALVIAHAKAPDAIDGVTPAIRFDQAMTLAVGGKIFELTYLGEGHGKDLIAVVVRPKNVAFIIDAAAPKRLLFRDMPRSNIDDWTNQIRIVEGLDFEIFAPAHGNVGVKADATEARVYMEVLRAKVLAGLKAGQSVDELVAGIDLTAYADWMAYKNWREPNIRGMARFLDESGQVK